ncbi:hypothetical protein FIV00_03425 [Labrenzia sp. THAF82]|nr:hypothetical protein FIV00_03425 [Labrenzia sp. THAF82]
MKSTQLETSLVGRTAEIVAAYVSNNNVDATSTGDIEARLNNILFTAVSARTFFEQLCASPQLIQAAITLVNQTLVVDRMPEKVKGSPVCSQVKEKHSDLCEALVRQTPQEPCDATTLPTSAQVRQAMQIAEHTGAALPEEGLRDAQILNAWIHACEPATKNHMKWIAKLVEHRKVRPPEGYPNQVSALEAKTFLNRHLGTRNPSLPSRRK